MAKIPADSGSMPRREVSRLGRTRAVGDPVDPGTGIFTIRVGAFEFWCACLNGLLV